MDLDISPETDRDHHEIRRVVRAAFVHQPESVADLVELIRASPQYVPGLALVARVDGTIAGHVMLSHTDLVEDDGSRREILTLSPLAVDPPHQRRGVGSALVRAGVAAADAMGEPLVVLEGSPAYYPRFGFVDCRTIGITIDLPDWSSRDAGQALPLTAYDAALRGRVEYPPAFAAVD